MLTHIYPHKAWRKIEVTICKITRLTAHFMCGLMSDLLILHLLIKSMVIHDTKCPFWDQVSLNNTNQTKPNFQKFNILRVNCFIVLVKFWVSNFDIAVNLHNICCIIEDLPPYCPSVVVKWVCYPTYTHTNSWGILKQPSASWQPVCLWLDVWFGELQIMKRVWSFMTSNVLTETRCHETTQKLKPTVHLACKVYAKLWLGSFQFPTFY